MEPLYCKYCGQQLLAEKEGEFFDVFTGKKQVIKVCGSVNCNQGLKEKDSLEKRILRRIKNAGTNGMIRSLLYQQSHLKANELDACVLSLLTQGLIIKEILKPPTGVEATIYKAVIQE